MDIDENFVKQTSSPEDVRKLSKTYLLCVTGDMLDRVFMMKQVGKYIRHI